MNIAQHILVLLVRIYRWVISPAKTALFGPLGRCRYTPTCSEYALEAVQVHGAAHGSWLAVRRVGSCHPWGGCGCDPVPEKLRITNYELRARRISEAPAQFNTSSVSRL